MKDKSKLYGVKGWLKFFVIMIGIVSPILGVLVTATAFSGTEIANTELLGSQNWYLYKCLSWALLFIVIAIQVKVAYDLYRKFVPQSVLQAKLMLMILPLAVFVWDQLFVFALSGIFTAEEIYVDLLKQYVSSIVWFLYLSSSIRVKNTYYKNKEIDIENDEVVDYDVVINKVNKKQ